MLCISIFRLFARESMVSFQQTLDQYKSPDKFKSPDISDFDLIHGVTSSTPNRHQPTSTLLIAQ
jgi:hypothetical protein